MWYFKVYFDYSGFFYSLKKSFSFTGSLRPVGVPLQKQAATVLSHELANATVMFFSWRISENTVCISIQNS